MQKKDDKFILSAGDINGFLNCKRLTELDTLVANKELIAPEFSNPHLKIMQERGFEHEKSYVDYLIEQGLSFESAEVGVGEDGYQKTISLMKKGVDVITQGVLRLDGWYGRSDVLKKVLMKSKLGDYSYIALDTKLSRETKAGSILQLCLYSEMLEEIQGILPEVMFVITPEDDDTFNEECYRVDDYQAYYRLVKSKLLESLGNIQAYPEPVGHCDVCRWWESCSKRRRDDDHLSIVANITKSQRKDLESIGINTMKAFASANIDDFKKLPSGTNLRSLELSKEQARVQVQARESGELVSEFMPFEDGRGLSRLPEPSAGDLFFDIEGDTFVGRHGIEYLLGLTYFDNGSQKYQGFWAIKPSLEKQAFTELMEFILQRNREFPDFHIYHYAAYEPGAIKRLAQRYSIYEEEVDNLLRADKFVDLYGVVRQGIRASVEKYSIKDLEAFTGYERKIALNDMIIHKRALEHNLELSRYDDINEAMINAVQLYNQDDTDSTLVLRNWLEKKRSEAIDAGNEILRPEAPELNVSEEIRERDQRLIDIKNALIAGIDFDSDLSREEEVKVLLGDLVSFYRREEKVALWELFRLRVMNEAELLEDKSGLAGLQLKERVAPTGRARTYTDVYTYPYQEADFRSGDEIFECGGVKVGTLVEYNPYERTVRVKKTAATNDLHPTSIFRFSIVRANELEESSIKVCEEIIENGMTDKKYKAIKDILLKKNPDCSVQIQVPENSSVLDHAYNIVSSLDSSYLPIQGPPGAGKSYTGSHLIQHLLKQGKKVGVSAISHKVINGLLTSTKKLVGDEFQIIHKVSDQTVEYDYRVTKKNPDCEALANGEEPVLIGGTSWLFARDGMEQTLDYLFIDEGGQLSLANLLSISRSAKNLIILGDCQQLEQPIQAAHPDGADLSALEYIQGESATIPEDKGLFLAKTFRLHPGICKFNSELFYENRLYSTEGNEGQNVTGPMNLKPLMYLETVHTGNSNYSLEEVERIDQLINDLVKKEHEFSIFNNKTQKLETKVLGLEHIMVVAPYNAQVQRLKDKLPDGVEIGTVDKFQGREAPIVIYSVTTSSPEDAPRGMDFLYSQSRLNVASSRAQCSFIMVANKEIFEPSCKSPAQMKLANAYCRFLEFSLNR
ncbi:TM0106 family RecB-like putative nuclease [Bacteriovorax sp. Seq25_V]|uniref:TM0106 family RecB-like putative nuclease n=1 Tax=Bacteriovorax sp. Seq25_V TaxID=1201288 RepID=UPI000389DA75|nr:TM0106 family RecB-like putative nuclease [Bacteriovorax sp. Seq25_V]EQC47178.1 nuclease, RecB family [Bacteriovorax sp. Seq25_V]